MDPADAIAAELVGLFGTGRQIPPLSTTRPGFGPTMAAAVRARLRRLRENRGERPVGRKIGFTNTTIWPLYGVDRPIWNHVFDTTLHDPVPAAFALTGLAEPRIEPEIVLGLASPPAPGMDLAELLGCIGWIAHGFEIVQSVFPGWRFSVADATAAYGLHGALLLGPRRPPPPEPADLASFTLTLHRDGAIVAEGHAGHVLGGPLHALRHLVGVLADEPGAPPLAAGEIVSTGTLTDAFPLVPGETWSTRLAGLPLPGLHLRVTG